MTFYNDSLEVFQMMYEVVAGAFLENLQAMFLSVRAFDPKTSLEYE